jgi:hypothetical protein
MWMRSSLVRMRSSLVWMRSSLEWMRSSLVSMKSGLEWMRSSLVVRVSDYQCRSLNSPGFDPSILRHSGIWGAADEAVLNTVHREKNKKNLLIIRSTISFLSSFAREGVLGQVWTRTIERLSTFIFLYFRLKHNFLYRILKYSGVPVLAQVLYNINFLYVKRMLTKVGEMFIVNNSRIKRKKHTKKVKLRRVAVFGIRFYWNTIYYTFK